ncbi:alpha/beta fold hydrolase [Nonomuraea longispora]|uniref:Alpha/beta fold hydrolase n=1 Tax=Nonomuraea longispora TaxID=1848320 RepID=A0A4R4NBQ2_9ACTN|nr:alpha/beta fold hydrolase [Nonomuraea longispora]TDC04032.1 alpha/beta fold hydrolase [Nonomuraea longispora]
MSHSVEVVKVNGLDLAVTVAGEGRPVILLHGFPDSATLWRHQIPRLVAEGYRVIAPDLRGFGASSRPADVAAYRLPMAVSDVAKIAALFAGGRAHVVGHDWGAAVAWMYASMMPAKVDHLVALSVGHPATGLSPSIEQRARSWYVLLFQFPDVAEELLRADDWRLMRQIVAEEGDVERYVADLARPGALTAGLNWYRANLAPALELTPARATLPVHAPTLGVWSSGDRLIAEEAMTGSARFVHGPWRYERIDGAGHWIPLDAPGPLGDLLLDFLGSHESVLPAVGRRRRF